MRKLYECEQTVVKKGEEEPCMKEIWFPYFIRITPQEYSTACGVCINKAPVKICDIHGGYFYEEDGCWFCFVDERNQERK
jgi:hypothetical protein